MKINGQFYIPKEILRKIKNPRQENSLDFITETPDPEHNENVEIMYSIFQDTLTEAGYKVQDYRGRFLYHGPAVFVKDFNEFQEILKHTPCKIQYEELGKTGFVIYPAYTKLGDY